MDSPQLVTVTIIFSGLVTLVPCTEKGGPIRVLLPDSAAHQVSGDGCRLAQHFPLLAIHAEDDTCCLVEPPQPNHGSSCGWEADDFLRPTNATDNPGYGWLLDKEVLEFEGDSLPPAGKTSLFEVSHELSTFPEGSDKRDYRWVGRPPENDVPDAECVTGVDCPLSGRVLLRQGELTSCHFATKPEARGAKRGGDRLRFSDTERLVLPAMYWGTVGSFSWFARITSPPPQARADAFQVLLQVWSGKKLVLRMRPLSDLRQPGRTITLWPHSPVTIWVENVPDPRALHLNHNCYRSGIDRHFEALYDNMVTARGERPALADVKVPRLSGVTRPLSYYGNDLDMCDVLEFGVASGVGGVPPFDKASCVGGRSAPVTGGSQ